MSTAELMDSWALKPGDWWKRKYYGTFRRLVYRLITINSGGGLHGRNDSLAGSNFIWYSHDRGSPTVCPVGKAIFSAPTSFAQFVLGNAIFMAYVLISVSLAIFYPGEWTLVLGLATAAWIFSNFLIHASLTLYTGEYSPGVVTASAIYPPVAVYIYSRLYFAPESLRHGRYYRVHYHRFWCHVCSNADSGMEREEKPPYLISLPE